MMNLFRSLLIQESQKNAQAEAGHAIDTINDTYKEWKKTKRRINAVDIITTAVNKITKIHPNTIDYIHDTAKLKLSIILMRIMDLPAYKPVETKRQIYKRIYPLLSKLQAYNPNTGSGGNLREIVMTRLSASITHELDPENKVFVCYEPSMNSSYADYIFGDKKPQKIFKMQSLSFPEDFETLTNILKINYQKAVSKVNRK